MSRKLSVKFNQKSYGAVFCAILLSAAMLTMSACATISGSQTRSDKSVRENKSDKPAESRGGKTVKDLIGKWHKTQGGKFADYAVYAENLGDFESYEITADGRVKSEALSVTRNYDCIVEVSAKSEGAITRVSDSQLNISLDVVTVRQTNACSPEKNSLVSTGATTANYQWKLREDESGSTELCLTQADGKTSCYRREE